MKRILLLCCVLPLLCVAQTGKPLQQKSLHLWNIRPANYSGITHIAADTFALVSDKEKLNGFFLFTIQQNPETGEILHVTSDSLRGVAPTFVDTADISLHDCEDIAYVPESNSLFISAEGDQTILEYDLNGQPTGRGLYIPNEFRQDNIYWNLGFEALTYDATSKRFWTTTEATLRSDGEYARIERPGVQNVLRIQSFNSDLMPCAQYAYQMDHHKAKTTGISHAFGVPALCALPDGRLLVMERELRISPNYLSSHVECKIFVVNPKESHQIDNSTDFKEFDPNQFMLKRLVATFTSKLSPIAYNIGNYEGMCLGRKLNDGRQTLILISDSQGGAKKHGFRVKDYLKVIVLED